MLVARFPNTLSEEQVSKQFCSPLRSRLKFVRRVDCELVGTLKGETQLTRNFTLFPSSTSSDIAALVVRLRELRAPQRTVVEEVCEGVGAVHAVWPE